MTSLEQRRDADGLRAAGILRVSGYYRPNCAVAGARHGQCVLVVLR